MSELPKNLLSKNSVWPIKLLIDLLIWYLSIGAVTKTSISFFSSALQESFNESKAINPDCLEGIPIANLWLYFLFSNILILLGCKSRIEFILLRVIGFSSTIFV